MSASDRVLYPMIGVGAFFALFWVGFVVAHEFGLACDALLLSGLALGTLGSHLVARLEGHDRRRGPPSGGLRPAPVPSRRRAAPAASGA